MSSYRIVPSGKNLFIIERMAWVQSIFFFPVKQWTPLTKFGLLDLSTEFNAELYTGREAAEKALREIKQVFP